MSGRQLTHLNLSSQFYQNCLKNGPWYWLKLYEKNFRKLSSFLIIGDWNVSVHFGTPVLCLHLTIRLKKSSGVDTGEDESGSNNAFKILNI